MVEFAFLRSRTFLGANGIAFVVSFAMLAMFFFMALYMQNILGYSPLEAGIRFLPTTVVIIVAAPIAGRLTDRIGARIPIAVGLCSVAVALYLQSRITVDTATATSSPPSSADGPRDRPHDVADVDRRDERRPRDQGRRRLGILSMSRMVGGTFGVAAVGALFQHLSDNRLEHALGDLPLSAAAAGLVRGQPRLRRRRPRGSRSSTRPPRTRSAAAEGDLRHVAVGLAEALDRRGGRRRRDRARDAPRRAHPRAPCPRRRSPAATRPRPAPARGIRRPIASAAGSNPSHGGMRSWHRQM